MSWMEKHDSIIHPEEPGNIEFMANYLGTTVEHLHAIIRTYKAEEEQKELKFKGKL